MKKVFCVFFIPCIYFGSSLFGNPTDSRVKNNNAISQRTTSQMNCCCRDYYAGFYLGLGCGVQNISAKKMQESLAVVSQGSSILPFADISNHSKEIANNFFVGELFLGIGGVFKRNIYLGGEIFIINNLGNDWKKSKISETLDANITFQSSGTAFNVASVERFISLSKDFEYGALLKLGILPIPKTMIYLLFGLKRAEFEIKRRDSGSVNPVAQFTSFVFKYSRHKEKIGWMPGIGIETMIGSNFSVRGEYGYTWFGSLSKSVKIDDTLSLDKTYTLVFEDETKFKKIAEGTFVFSLVYHFRVK